MESGGVGEKEARLSSSSLSMSFFSLLSRVLGLEMESLTVFIRAGLSRMKAAAAQ